MPRGPKWTKVIVNITSMIQNNNLGLIGILDFLRDIIPILDIVINHRCRSRSLKNVEMTKFCREFITHNWSKIITGASSFCSCSYINMNIMICEYRAIQFLHLQS